MLNAEQDETYKTNKLYNINSSVTNAHSNDESDKTCYVEQNTPASFASKSSLSSHVLNSHAQLAR